MWMVVVLHAAVTASYNSISVSLGTTEVGTWVPTVLTTVTVCGAAALMVASLAEKDATTRATSGAHEPEAD
jgi:hypothetical protein